MQDMGAGRDLGECCGSVETRFGLGWRANWCSDHPLGASSYSIVLGRKKGLCSGTPQDIKRPKIVPGRGPKVSSLPRSHSPACMMRRRRNLCKERPMGLQA